MNLLLFLLCPILFLLGWYIGYHVGAITAYNDARKFAVKAINDMIEEVQRKWDEVDQS
jgi:lipopolysaccharide biosynthesis regulator YciM